MASGTNAVCHYQGRSDPPTNYTDWSELIGALGEHMVAKYGEETASEFFFEVGTPFLSFLFFFLIFFWAVLTA